MMDDKGRHEAEPLIELGIASADTFGGVGEMVEAMGLWRKTGLTDD